MKNYFAGLTTATEINSVYKALRVAFHPDNGGNAADFQELTTQHAAALAALDHSTTAADGAPLELPAAVIGLPEHCETSTMDADALKMIERASLIPGVSVELCGSWVWVTGNTKPVKDQLKELRFRYSSGKRAWYWHDPREGYRRRGRRHYSLDEIRDMHGSQKLA